MWPPWPQRVALGPLLALRVTMPSKASQAKAARVANVHPLFRLSPLYHPPSCLQKPLLPPLNPTRRPHPWTGTGSEQRAEREPAAMLADLASSVRRMEEENAEAVAFQQAERALGEA